MKPTRQLIIIALSFFFVLTLNVYGQERKTKKEIKKEKTEKLKKNKKTETVRSAKGEVSPDNKKVSSKMLKSGSKGDPSGNRKKDKGVGTKKEVKSFKKKKKLDSDGIISPNTISKVNKKKVKAKKTLKQKKKNKQLKKKQ